MTPHSAHSARLAAAAVCSVTAAFAVWHARGSDLMRVAATAVHDGISPGRILLNSIESPVGADTERGSLQRSADETETLQRQLAESDRQRRQLLIENARLSNAARRQARVPVSAIRPDSLFQHRTISAAVISPVGMSDQLRTLMIDAGKRHGIRRSDLLLESDLPLLDIGRDGGLTPGSPVLSGRIVVGRIAETGAWVSSVIPLDSPEFSAAVRLVRFRDLQAHTVAEGTLIGTGNGECRVSGISHTSSVAVGDEVFTVGAGEDAPADLYIGTVTQAEFLSGGEWDVIVKTAVEPESLESVDVVHTDLNPQRISGIAAGVRPDGRMQ